MNLISKEINDYCENFTENPHETLPELARETYIKVPQPRMLSGHLQGQFLKMVAQMCRPKVILEIGTYTGYSAICLAQGLAKNGKLYSIEINPERASIINKYWQKAGMEHKAELLIGDALTVIEKLEIKPDLVFIDADKENYLNYYKLVIEKLQIGGIILVDNVLWSGKVPDAQYQDRETNALREFNLYVKNDARVSQLLLPLRDGIMCMIKNEK